MSRFTLRLVLLVVLVGGVVFGASSSALATTETGTQNPDLTVTASISPDYASVGDVITISASVTNNTSRPAKVATSANLIGPNGSVLYSKSSDSRTIPSGKSVNVSYSVLDDGSLARGVYRLEVVATNANGSSSAGSSITLG